MEWGGDRRKGKVSAGESAGGGLLEGELAGTKRRWPDGGLLLSRQEGRPGSRDGAGGWPVRGWGCGVCAREGSGKGTRGLVSGSESK